jgi:hypothetical protein
MFEDECSFCGSKDVIFMITKDGDYVGDSCRECLGGDPPECFDDQAFMKKLNDKLEKHFGK